MQKLTIRENVQTHKLGKKVFELPTPWKISALAELPGGVMLGAYHNDTRRDSQIYWNGKPLTHLVDGREAAGFDAETIGQPLVLGDYAVVAGECGHLIGAIKGHVFVYERVQLKWATTCAMYNSTAYVLDSNGIATWARECVTGDKHFVMPGTGIIMAATEFDGFLWAAMADSDDKHHGLSCSNGDLRWFNSCQCVVNAWGRLLFSTGNEVWAMDRHGPVRLGDLPCEKIMDMRMVETGDLRIAGANPDTAWEADHTGTVYNIGTIRSGNAKVGGSCFRVRVSDKYFARCRDGHTGEVYEIIRA